MFEKTLNLNLVNLSERSVAFGCVLRVDKSEKGEKPDYDRLTYGWNDELQKYFPPLRKNKDALQPSQILAPRDSPGWHFRHKFESRGIVEHRDHRLTLGLSAMLPDDTLKSVGFVEVRLGITNSWSFDWSPLPSSLADLPESARERIEDEFGIKIEDSWQQRFLAGKEFDDTDGHPQGLTIVVLPLERLPESANRKSTNILLEDVSGMGVVGYKWPRDGNVPEHVAT